MWLLLSNLDTHHSDADEQRKFVLPLLAQVTSEQLGGLLGQEPGAPVGQGLRCFLRRGDRYVQTGSVGSLGQHLLSAGQTRSSAHDTDDISVSGPPPRQPGDSEQENESLRGQVHCSRSQRQMPAQAVWLQPFCCLGRITPSIGEAREVFVVK